jgi:hypothetical protein
MNNEQIRLLHKMKKLVYAGYRRFESRKDRDYIQDLLEIGISVQEAWNEILSLSAYNYFQDYRPFYSKPNGDSLVFKKIINDQRVYIKLKIEKYDGNDNTVCLSFHIDHK